MSASLILEKDPEAKENAVTEIYYSDENITIRHASTMMICCCSCQRS